MIMLSRENRTLWNLNQAVVALSQSTQGIYRTAVQSPKYSGIDLNYHGSDEEQPPDETSLYQRSLLLAVPMLYNRIIIIVKAE